MLPALILISPTAMLLVMTRPEALGFDLNLLEREDLHRWIDATGHLGPILVVGLITVAIVASPLPSAPVALAAGATYGQTFGTILVVLGAELGAIAAFFVRGSRRRSAMFEQLMQEKEIELMNAPGTGETVPELIPLDQLPPLPAAAEGDADA